MLLQDWLQGWWQVNVRNRRPVRRLVPQIPRVRRAWSDCSAAVEHLENRTVPAFIDLATLSVADGVVVFNDNSNDLSGTSVSNVGDLDGDGFDDVAIGAPGNLGQPGAIYIIFGGSNVPAALDLQNLGTFGMTILGVNNNDYAGGSVAAGGDVNGDGFDDLIIGAPNASSYGRPGAGESYIVFGGDNLPFVLNLFFLGDQGTVVFGADGGDNSGSAVSSAGDVNRDGFDDILIGASRADGLSNGRADSGEAYLIFGEATLPQEIDLNSLGTAGARIFGADVNDRLGLAVSGAGDINGDGFDDLVLGTNYADGIADNESNAGESYVIFGAALFPTSVDLAGFNGLGFTIFGAEANDYSGFEVSGIGDFDGDGFEDIALTAPYADGSANGRNNSGETYIIFGGAGLGTDIDLESLGAAGSTLLGAQAADLSGKSVRGAGDVNGDGFDDVIIGAPTTYGFLNGRPYSGESYVVFGLPNPAQTIDLGSLSDDEGFTIFGVDAGDNSGSSVSGAGDIDGDGFDDLVIGAYSARGPYNDQLLAGEAYIIYGGDFTGAVTHPGNSNDNTLTGNADANVMNGARGDDLLIGNGGADVLLGGEGNDTLAITTTNFARIDGGNGRDFLRLDGSGINLDLTAIADTRLANLETIDIRGSGANTLTLDFSEVIVITGNSNPNFFANTLFVRRDKDDTVNIGPGWTDDGTEAFNGVLYNVFVQGTAVLAIQNTDPLVSLSILPNTLAEGGGMATVTATLTEVSTENITVNLGFGGTATSPADYTASGQQIVILAGNLSNSITLTGVQDGQFEGPESVVVSITSVINGLESGTQQVTGQITDDDSAPAFTSTATPSAPENQTAVLTVQATDADLPPQVITFSITGGADAAKFSITPTGDLTFNTAPDFENPTDANSDNVYVVQVTANDGNGGTTAQTISVSVTNVAEAVEISVGSPAVTYVKKQPPITVLPQATVGGANLGGGELVLDLTFVAKRSGKRIDTVILPDLSGIAASSTEQLVNGHLILTITLNPGATAAGIQGFLRGITFSTKGKGLKTPTRTLAVTLTNNLNQSATTTQTINVVRKP